MRKNSIAIIIPYFGSWPEWIDLFFYSCNENSHIDWYFFTDCETSYAASNIHFIPISFNAYCTMVSKKLDINFKPDSPYKLCDLKVFYGYIHEDIIKNYDFWGFGDVDVVWGDIKSFYTEKMLKKYHVFSTCCDRLSGHFAIIRNDTKYNILAFKIKNWKTKLETNHNFALDEKDFSFLLYPFSYFLRKFYSKVLQPLMGWNNAWVFYYRILPFLNIILGLKFRKIYFKEQHTTPFLSDDGKKCKHDAEEWYYKNSKITNNRTTNEYIYIHFMFYKKNNFRKKYYWIDEFYQIKTEINIHSAIIINKNGIVKNNRYE